MSSFKKIMFKDFIKTCKKMEDREMEDKNFEFKTGGRMSYHRISSAEKLLDIINLLEENRLYGLFKTKGAIGVIADGFIPKKNIEDKIRELEKEKNYYYSDWKLEELNNQIKILKELLDSKEE